MDRVGDLQAPPAPQPSRDPEVAVESGPGRVPAMAPEPAAASDLDPAEAPAAGRISRAAASPRLC